MKKLTDAFVKTVTAPEKGRVELRDSEVRGFALRVTDRGAKSWVFIHNFNGSRGKVTLGSYPELSLADARKQARQHRGEVARGEEPGAAKRTARAAKTIGEAADDYIERWAKPNKRTWKQDAWAFKKYVLPYWASRKLVDITRADVINLLDHIADGAPIQANRVRALLSKFFRFAISKALCEANPVRDTERPTKERPRQFELTPAQIRQIWKSIREIDAQLDAGCVRDFYHLSFLTCARRGELLGMLWSELDLDSAVWVLPGSRTKNGQPWSVPLPPTAVAILHARKAASTAPFVFADKNGAPYKASAMVYRHEQFTKKVGVAFRIHDVRSIVSTQLSKQMGVQDSVIDRILNHLPTSVTGRHYNRNKYEPEHRRALLHWDSWLQGIVEPRGEVVPFPSVAVAS
jgi:integrase